MMQHSINHVEWCIDLTFWVISLSFDNFRLVCYGWTDGWTDKASCRDAWTHLEIVIFSFAMFAVICSKMFLTSALMPLAVYLQDQTWRATPCFIHAKTFVYGTNDSLFKKNCLSVCLSVCLPDFFQKCRRTRLRSNDLVLKSLSYVLKMICNFMESTVQFRKA